MCKGGDVVHVFPPGERLGVGEGDGGQAAPQSRIDDLFRRPFIGLRLLGSRLGDVAVLAPSAGEIAARAAEGEAPGTRHEVVKGFLLHGVDGEGAGHAVREGVELAIPAFTAAAQSPAPFLDAAMMGAEKALDTVISGFIEPRFRHSSDSLTTSV